MIEFGGRYTYEQARAAQVAVSGMRAIYRKMSWIVLAVLVAGFASAFSGDTEGGPNLTLLILAPLLIGGAVYAARVRSRKVFEALPASARELAGTFDHEGIRLRFEGGESTAAWSSFHRLTLGKDMALLYASPEAAHPFPRSFFRSDEDWQRFGGWARAGVPAAPLVHWRRVRRLLVSTLVLLGLTLALYLMTRGGG